MKGVRGLAGVAAVMLALGVVARAADDSMTGTGNGSDSMISPAPSDTATPSDTSSDNTSNSGQATPTRGALMQGLDAVGLGKSLDNLGITVGGYAEGGYLYDFSVHGDQSPAKTAPGDNIYFAGPYKNSFMLNQADLYVDRTIQYSPDKWDIGFRIEGGYGRDFFFTHSNGVLDQDNKAGGTNSQFSQPDIPQAYVTLGVPLGDGVQIKIGKFVDILGVEKIDPTQNLFYSHTYAFGYGEPFTETGIIASYRFGDQSGDDGVTTIAGGVTRGWNQTLYDNNSDPDIALQFNHSHGDLSFGINALVGPEGVLPYGPPDRRDWWLEPELWATYQISDNLTFTGDLLYGVAPNTAEWLSLAGYLSYQVDKMVAISGRAEFYYDQGGVTTGVGGSDVDYFDLTLGLAIKPLPDSSIFNTLTIRPEIRGDFANQPVIDFTHHTQGTGAVDVYWKF